MSEPEKTFLLQQTYGTRYIHEPTRFPEPSADPSPPAVITATKAV